MSKPMLVAEDGSKSCGVVCCGRSFATANEALIHEIVHAKQANPSYGFRRIAQTLRNAHGDVWPTNYAVETVMRKLKQGE